MKFMTVLASYNYQDMDNKNGKNEKLFEEPKPH